MAQQSVGLVLRARSVEAFQTVRGFGGLKVVKLVSVPVESTDDISISEAIRQAVTEAGLRNQRVAVSVPSQDILLRAFLLPLLPKTEWTSAVQFEARKYIPFKMEELVWGYYALERRATKQLAVTFAGIRIDRLAQIRRWLSLAGVKPSLVEAQAISLARLAAHTPQGVGNQFVGIVDVDRQANTAHIVIAKNQVPYLSRDITLKTDPVTAPGALGSSEMLAEAKTAPDGVDARAEILLSELRLSFDFFIREHPKAIIHQVHLFGEEGLIAPWVSWLAQQLPCPVFVGKLAGLAHGLEQFGAERAAAAGVALGELSTHPVKIDFLVSPATQVHTTRPADFLKAFSFDPNVGQRLVSALSVQIATAALALGLMFGAVQYRLGLLRQEMAQIVRTFPDVGWGLKDKSTDDLQTAQQTVDKHLAFLRQTVAHRVAATEKLDQLVRTLPDGVWLEGLEYKDSLGVLGASQQSLQLRGYCFLPVGKGDEMGLISDFVRQLKKNQGFFQGFSVAQLGGISSVHDAQTEADYQSFQVTCDSEGTRLY